MAVEVPKKAEDEVLKLQQYQQQLQMLSMQKQQLQSQVLEIEHSIKEIDNVTKEDVYEIVGTIMIKRDKHLLKNALMDKKKTIDLRQGVIEKQLDKISKKTSEIQAKVMEMIKGDSK